MTDRNRPLLWVLATALAVLALAAVAAIAAQRSVAIGDDWFVRPSGHATVHIHKGDSVRWRWTGQDFHNVTVRRGPEHFHSGTKDHGTFSHRFRHRGTYVIYCTVHGPGMSMRVAVR
jgi:plastocyanin